MRLLASNMWQATILKSLSENRKQVEISLSLKQEPPDLIFHQSINPSHKDWHKTCILAAEAHFILNWHGLVCHEKVVVHLVYRYPYIAINRSFEASYSLMWKLTIFRWLWKVKFQVKNPIERWYALPLIPGWVLGEIWLPSSTHKLADSWKTREKQSTAWTKLVTNPLKQ